MDINFLTIGLISHFILLLFGIFILQKSKAKIQSKREALFGIFGTALVFSLFAFTFIDLKIEAIEYKTDEEFFKIVFTFIAGIFGLISAVYNFTDHDGNPRLSHVLSIALVGLAIGLNIWIEKIEDEKDEQKEVANQKAYLDKMNELELLSKNLGSSEREQFQSIISEIGYNKSSNNVIAGNIVETKNSVLGVKDQLDQTDEKVDTLQVRIAKNSSSIKRSNENIKTVGEYVLETQNQLDDLDSSLIETNSSIVSLEENIHQTVSDVDSINTSLSNTEEKMKEFQGTLATTNASISSISEQLAALSEQMDKNKFELLRKFLHSIENDSIVINHKKMAIAELEEFSNEKLAESIQVH